ncbi:short chain enoyl-CoA hydratase [Caballeronia sordidicola]|uniref:Short chain enoyl-CoA hydratase n=1 Tax=Caballeronia sordidicola TaxID=196367 RepID=A0A158GL17_CABSO|nr:enoyl-CoA hydratase/isomerase family protein [Caballeronia sordidicola]SAL32794.1 short chain enoyl-CoA hydratase [Caballeronia sordidicola]
MTETGVNEGFSWSRHEGVVTIRLTRVAQHNRIDPADIAGLRESVANASSNADSIALVITGSGNATFSSGYTLAALAAGNIDDSFESLLNELETCPLPTICALNGSAYGGATDLALCCDIRIGVEGSRMFMPAARIGLHYYPDGMRRYIRELGLAQAKRLFLTGMTIDAPEMLRIGFLTDLVAAEQLTTCTTEYIDALRACEPDAVRSMKRQLNAIAASDPSALADRSAYQASLQSPAIAERIKRRRS